jgi:ketosteroid isomerase-like protein
MSGENADLVRRAFEVHESEGIEASLRFFAADVAWYPSDRWLDVDVYRGHDGMRAVQGEWVANFDDWGWSAHEIRDAGEKVVVLAEMKGQVKGAGVPISRQVGLVVSDIHDGTMGTIHAYASWEEALEAAGLEG